MKRGGPLKRKTPMKRSGGGLKRGGPLKRETRIKPLNAPRLEARNAVKFGDLAAFVRTMPCACCGADPPSQACHVRTRGSGGGQTHIPDMSTMEVRGNLVGLCGFCHTMQDVKIRDGFDMQAAADAAYERFQAIHGPRLR